MHSLETLSYAASPAKKATAVNHTLLFADHGVGHCLNRVQTLHGWQEGCKSMDLIKVVFAVKKQGINARARLLIQLRPDLQLNDCNCNYVKDIASSPMLPSDLPPDA